MILRKVQKKLVDSLYNILDLHMAWIAGVQLNLVFVFPPSQFMSEFSTYDILRMSDSTHFHGGLEQ